MSVVRICLFLLLASLLLLLPSAVNPQTTVDPVTGQITIVIDPSTGQTLTVNQNQPLEEINQDPNATNVSPYLGDDGSTTIILPFTFEYYGQSFNTVQMYSNGVLSFSGLGGSYCCDGQDISQLTDPSHNYIIAAAWSDLYTLSNNAYYLGTEESATFGWYGVFEFYNPENVNSFEIQLFNSGDITLSYGDMTINSHTVSAGLTGNLSEGEYVDLYYGQGFNSTTSLNPDGGGVNQCELDPLSSPSCPGYQQAYYNQQCSLNPLYDSGCPGYAQAYYNQQCSINALYDSGCPGYQQAYYNQQCQLDPLYDTGCAGFEQAYYDQQCSINPLYDSGCPGYTDAVFQQNCSQDPLFNQSCPGFSVAMAIKLAQEQQQQTFAENFTDSQDLTTTTGDAALDQLLSVLPEPVELASMQDEIVQTVTTEEVTATAAMEQPTPEDQAAAEEMMTELVSEKDKQNPDKQKAAVAAKIAELKKELASGEMSAKEVAAVQAQLALLLAYVPGFDQYYIVIPDAPFYEQEQVYRNATLPDNPQARRMGLASELRYEEMVQQQYNRR